MWALRNRLISLLTGSVSIDEQRAAKSFGSHFLEIAFDCGFVRVTVQPPPVTPETCLRRRRLKAGLESLSGDCPGSLGDGRLHCKASEDSGSAEANKKSDPVLH